jgi:hypothetical protein
VTEFLATPERGWVSGVTLATYLITNLPGVAQVRLVQEIPEEIVIRARAVEGGTLPRDQLLARAAAYLGGGIRLSVVEDPDLRPEGSGKFRFTVSALNPVGARASAFDRGVQTGGPSHGPDG